MNKINAFALAIFLLLSLAFAQDPGTSPTSDYPIAPGEDYIGPLSVIEGMIGSMFDSVMQLISNSKLMFPLPGDAIMDKEVCHATGNAILDMFMIGGDLYRISFMAAAAGAMFIAFIYILGKAFENKKWVDYSKNELFEIGITIVVVLLILVPLIKVIGCVNMFDRTGMSSTYQAAFAYPKDIIGSVTIMSVVLYSINAIMQNILNVKVVQNVFAGLSGSLGVGGDDPSFGSLSQAGMILVVVTGLASLMAYLHEFVTYGFIAYLLPLGIILRFFAPTRKIGGTIIGLVFGMAVLLPFMLAIGHSVIAVNFFPVFMDLGHDPPQLTSPFLIAIKGNVTKLFMFDAAASAQEDAHFTEGVAYDEYGNPVEKPELAAANPNLLSFLFGIMADAIGTIMSLLVLASGGGVLCFGGTIYPLIVSVILISGVKYISGALGEEIDVSNLTRLV